jgi:hypothetical protein
VGRYCGAASRVAFAAASVERVALKRDQASLGAA